MRGRGRTRHALRVSWFRRNSCDALSMVERCMLILKSRMRLMSTEYCCASCFLFGRVVCFRDHSSFGECSWRKMYSFVLSGASEILYSSCHFLASRTIHLFKQQCYRQKEWHTGYVHICRIEVDNVENAANRASFFEQASFSWGAGSIVNAGVSSPRTAAWKIFL